MYINYKKKNQELSTRVSPSSRLNFVLKLNNNNIDYVLYREPLIFHYILTGHRFDHEYLMSVGQLHGRIIPNILVYYVQYNYFQTELHVNG